MYVSIDVFPAQLLEKFSLEHTQLNPKVIYYIFIPFDH